MCGKPHREASLLLLLQAVQAPHSKPSLPVKCCNSAALALCARSALQYCGAPKHHACGHTDFTDMGVLASAFLLAVCCPD